MTEPIRVAQVVGKMVGGGVEAVVMNYYRHIDRSEVQFDFLVDSDSTLVPREEIESLGGRVFEIPPYQHVVEYQKELQRLFRQESWCIVHSHINALSIFPLRAAKISGIPVRIAHSHSTSGKGEYSKNAMKWILRHFANNYPTARVACSERAGRWLFGEKHDFTLFYNAIDLERFKFNAGKRKRTRDELDIENDKFMESRTEDAEDSRNVMVKILVPGSDETRNRVILATNNQTQVKKTSLRATDQIHIQIELYMKRNGLYYERRKNYYKNQGRKREEIVTLSFLAQCMMSILLGRPDQARARPSTLLSDEVQYKKIFGQDGNLEAYYRAASLGKQVCLKFPQIKRDLEGSQISDIRFYVIMGVASMLSNKDSLTFGDIENLDLDKLSDEIIQTVADMVMDVYLALGGTSKAAKSYAMASKVKEKISLLLP